MKKMLLIMGLLAVSGMAFGAQQGQATSTQPWVEGEVDVKARVVEDLKMTSTNTVVDFGTLLKGQQNKSEVTAGKLDISGGAGANIIITVKGPDDQNYQGTNEVSNGLSVNLKKDGTDVNNKLATTLKFSDKSNSVITDKVVSLDEAGSYTININGTASAEATQVVGDYSEKVFVKAQYE